MFIICRKKLKVAKRKKKKRWMGAFTIKGAKGAKDSVLCKDWV